MNKFAMFIAGICWIAAGYGQGVQQRKLTIKPGEVFTYSFFCESPSPKGILLGMPDNSGEKWNHESWCRELYPIAEKNEWLLLAPMLEGNVITDQGRVEKMVELYRDSVSGRSVRSVSLGNGDALAVAFVAKGIPALIISPESRNIHWPAGTVAETAVAISADSDNPVVQSLYDTLATTGQWLRVLSHNEGKDYYIPDHYQVYDDLLLWVDSMHLALGDSIARIQLNAQPGVKNAIPEVLRQGQPVPLTLWITKPANYTIQVFDLSANAVHTEQHFLGKGKHSIVIPTEPLNWGVYHIEVTGGGLRERYKFMIRG